MYDNENLDLRGAYKNLDRSRILVNYNIGGAFFLLCLFLLMEGFRFFVEYVSITQSWFSVMCVIMYDLGIVGMLCKTKYVRRGHWFFWPKIMMTVTGTIVTFLLLLKIVVFCFY